MKSIIAGLLIILFAQVRVSAQEVEVKKISVFVNGTEELTRDKCPIGADNSTCVFSSTKTQLPVFSLHIIRYVEVGKALMTISFIDFDLTCRLSTTFKDLYKHLYQLGVIDATGKADQEKAKAFYRLYNEKKEE